MDNQPSTPPSPGGDDRHLTPVWVKGFIIAAVVAVLLVVVVLAVGSGGHGPSRHLPTESEAASQTPEGHVSSMNAA